MGTSEKLLAVFGLFTIDEPEWTVERAAERLGLGTSTAYRFFKSLSEVGLISSFATGRYVLGPAIVQLDRQIRLLDPLMSVAQPVMRQVADDLKIPGVMLLGRLFRKDIICIHQEAFERPSSTVSYERGRPMPLHRGAVSKIIMAHMPPRLVKGIYESRRSDMAVMGYGADWDAVKSSLRKLRSTRVCLSFGELDAGMVGFGAALRSPTGQVDASLGFVLPEELNSPKRQSRLVEAIETAADMIEARLALATTEQASKARSVRSRRKARPRSPKTVGASAPRASGSAVRA